MTYMKKATTVQVLTEMNAILNKIEQLNNLIKYGNLNGPDLANCMDDKRELQKEYDQLKLNLCDYEKN